MKNIQRLTFLFLFAGLVIACKPSGDKAATTEAAKVEKTSGETFKVDVASSKVLWEGAKVSGKHNGSVDVSAGELMMENGTLTGGKFTLDMNSIAVLDLEGDKKGYLEGHLKGMADDNANDFFNVKAFPNATFEITKATKLINDEAANYVVSGNLTMKDVTKQVSFKAKVMTEGGNVKVSTPQFTINRTDWGIKYGSASFFDGLKDKAINDDMGLSINLTAMK